MQCAFMRVEVSRCMQPKLIFVARPKQDLQEQQLPVNMPAEEPEEFEDALEDRFFAMTPAAASYVVLLEVPYVAEQSADATRSELWKARKARSQEQLRF